MKLVLNQGDHGGALGNESIVASGKSEVADVFDCHGYFPLSNRQMTYPAWV